MRESGDEEQPAVKRPCHFSPEMLQAVQSDQVTFQKLLTAAWSCTCCVTLPPTAACCDHNKLDLSAVHREDDIVYECDLQLHFWRQSLF